MKELAALASELSALLLGLDAAQTALRPRAHPEKWSVQQIVGHLLLTYSVTGSSMEARIGKGRPTRSQPTLAQRVAQILVLGAGYMPSGRKSPPMVTPPDEFAPRLGAELATSAKRCLCRLEQLTQQAEVQFGPGPWMTHPSLGPLSSRQWRRFQLIHGRHHLRQARAILTEHGFAT